MIKNGLFAAIIIMAPLALTGCFHDKNETNANMEKALNQEQKNNEGQMISVADGSYPIDTGSSELRWHGEKLIGSSHDGTIGIKSGELEIKDDNIVGGHFVIDMATIQDDKGTEMLVRHLSGEDFFDVEEYPEARLAIKNIEEAGGGQYRATADLEIKGMTNEIQFLADTKINGTMLTAGSEFTIDRTRWDIRYGSGKFFKSLGDAAIRDEITFDVRIVVDTG